ncbi:MAG: ubiquinol-cytochrome c reductase iron-sulfur subunit [Bryobacteraceae bacterium]
MDRRRFYLAAIYGLNAVIGAAMAIPAALYLLVPPKTKKGTAWVEATDLGQLQPNAPQEVVFRRNRVDGWKVVSEKTTAWVVKKSDTEAFALAPGCTHLGCAYHWEAAKNSFVCPCHTSLFSIDGKVLEGPAPRPLDRFETKLSGTKLLIGPVKVQDKKA